MAERYTVTLNSNELKAMKELEEIKPEWKYFKESEKAKELFWRGYRAMLREELLRKTPGVVLDSGNKESGQMLVLTDDLPISMHQDGIWIMDIDPKALEVSR